MFFDQIISDILSIEAHRKQRATHQTKWAKHYKRQEPDDEEREDDRLTLKNVLDNTISEEFIDDFLKNLEAYYKKANEVEVNFSIDE